MGLSFMKTFLRHIVARINTTIENVMLLINYRNGLKMYSKIPLALADGMNDGE